MAAGSQSSWERLGLAPAARRLLVSVAIVLCAAPAHAGPEPCVLPTIQELRQIDTSTLAAHFGHDDRLLRNFVLFCYRNLADDVINGRGPYVDTLRTVFASACPDEPSLLRWLAAVLVDSETAVEFAHRVSVASYQIRGIRRTGENS
jgi:hypothetical protein